MIGNVRKHHSINRYDGSIVSNLFVLFLLTGYTITDLDFEHSAATLPIPDQKISHEEYFAQKGIHLEYPREGPMIVIEGRHKQRIYLPPELVLVSTP